MKDRMRLSEVMEKYRAMQEQEGESFLLLLKESPVKLHNIIYEIIK